MSNFQFLKDEWRQLHKEATEAEQLAFASPKASAVLSRSVLENTVRWLYAHDSDLSTPYDTKLSSLMHAQCFKDILPPPLFREINVVRKVGNSAAHGENVTRNESLITLKHLFRFLGFVASIYSKSEPEVPTFDERLIPDGKEVARSKQEIQKLQASLSAEQERARKEQEKLEQQAKELAELKAELEAKKQEVQARKIERKGRIDTDKVVPQLVSEQATRKLYIDLSLKEAGWNHLREGYELEYEVKGMPKSTNPSGIGYADYVLWGDNGKPLAVIEAKKTMADARKGRHQAELYANCLESMHRQRPVIYYTNGFDTYLWDDQFYIDREVQGFYTKDELNLLINRRTSRKDPRNFQVDTNIASRPYQLEAIQRVAENLVVTNQKGILKGKSRESLLVMATGSGKTRTAAAIVDMLTKTNWAKRVLFLADRNALVTQAKNAFSEHLPHLSSIDLTKEKEDNGTRLVFSTYPTIMNKIDSLKTEDNRFYGVGHFDLIIIDEAHRSVYQKYGAIFEYFDSLLIGLTATPKNEVDRNTYSLFGIEDDNPTFAYELDDAVQDKYLVPYKAMSVPLKFHREGIKYSELNDKEKQEYEEKFGDPTIEEADEWISGSALNKWLFNTDTVDKVLHFLMEQGIKVEGGDKLGKTIIFAKNHKHAAFIEERFNKHYPEHSGQFLRVIDNYETKAQDLLETFADKNEEKDPQIAVSVDMMDTGVDAPRVVNLVFFKAVKSYAKFWQMIGRGTRLSPDLFAPGEDKTHFLIFDYCENFEFFDENPEGIKGSSRKSMSQLIFDVKLELATEIRKNPDASEADQKLAEELVAELHKIISSLNKDRFDVRMKLRYVEEFQPASRWVSISNNDFLEITTHLSGLVLPFENDDETARRFDLMMLNFKLTQLKGADTNRFASKLVSVARELSKKMTVPAVKAEAKLIKSIQEEDYWESPTLKTLDDTRRALRDLIKFIDIERQEIVYTNFQDYLNQEDIIIREHEGTTYSPLKNYKERVESFIRENIQHIVIQKLNRNKQITETDLKSLEEMLFNDQDLGSKDDFLKEYGEQPLGTFIRSIVGLDIQSANEAFSDFLQAGNLRADQMKFIDNIINYLNKNGIIEPAQLFSEPFTYINDEGLMGVFDDADVHKVISIVERINENAVKAFPESEIAQDA